MRRSRSRERSESGYVAIMTAMLAVILFGMAAFAVDVGRWYLVGKQAQRAADAGALAGVPHLPDRPDLAKATAHGLTSANDFTHGGDVQVVPALEPGSPTRLRVTVSKKVENFFGGLLGVPTTTITRSAVADYAGPVPMGSPCNEFGADPYASEEGNPHCNGVGDYWANVGSKAAPKRSGDAYQNGVCSPGDDRCAAGNEDYDENGYFFAITLTKDINDFRLEIFDPALVNVGDFCERNLEDATKARNPFVTDEANRYKDGSERDVCTGDIRFGGTGEVRTRFTLRDPGPNPWDPTSFPPRPGCERTFDGYDGNLRRALDDDGDGQYQPYVAEVFRRWVPLCSTPSLPKGTYLLQVKTNGLGMDSASGHNRFAIRAYSESDPSEATRTSIAVSAFTKMAIYANLPSADTEFHLARVPSGSAGHILNVRLFDVGDAENSGTISVVPPKKSKVDFVDCVGSGPRTGPLPDCSMTANRNDFQGKWQTISVPIPPEYTCDDLDPAACWVMLEYSYGHKNQPSDTTSWQASIEGDPVRLVE